MRRPDLEWEYPGISRRLACLVTSASTKRTRPISARAAATATLNATVLTPLPGARTRDADRLNGLVHGRRHVCGLDVLHECAVMRPLSLLRRLAVPFV